MLTLSSPLLLLSHTPCQFCVSKIKIFNFFVSRIVFLTVLVTKTLFGIFRLSTVSKDIFNTNSSAFLPHSKTSNTVSLRNDNVHKKLNKIILRWKLNSINLWINSWNLKTFEEQWSIGGLSELLFYYKNWSTPLMKAA